MDNFSFLNAAHSGFFAELYEQYLKDPDSLEPSWKAFFQGYDFANSDFLKGEIVEGVSPQIPDDLQKEFKVINLINGYRSRGHLFTKQILFEIEGLIYLPYRLRILDLTKMI